MKIGKDFYTAILEIKDIRELFSSGSLGLMNETEAIELGPGISLSIIRQVLDDVEREQNEKNQAEQDSGDSSALPR